jgi:hypothetical protein
LEPNAGGADVVGVLKENPNAARIIMHAKNQFFVIKVCC